jgi:hypothetical protein
MPLFVRLSLQVSYSFQRKFIAIFFLLHSTIVMSQQNETIHCVLSRIDTKTRIQNEMVRALGN